MSNRRTSFNAWNKYRRYISSENDWWLVFAIGNLLGTVVAFADREKWIGVITLGLGTICLIQIWRNRPSQERDQGDDSGDEN